MKQIKNISQIKILTLLISAAILLTFAFACSSEPNASAKTAALAFNRSLLDEIIEQYEIYRPFIDDAEKEISEDLKSAVSNIYDMLDSKSGTENEIKDAVNRFNEAAEMFRVNYFDLDGDKVRDANLIEKLYIDEVRCAYDEQAKTFYYTMGEIKGREFKFNFHIESNLKTGIFAEIYDSGGNKTDYKFVPVLNREYKLKSYSSKLIYEYKIIFTMLPIVQVDDIRRIDDGYKDCTISVTEPDYLYGGGAFASDTVAHMFTESSAQIHIRGSSARWHPKKAYAIKFVDENKENKKVSFFDIRKESHWILDSMYNDIARMRNRVSTDLWLSFSGPLYYEHLTPKPVSNGTQGGFVELFVNNEYMGLYCLTTKINRRQLQLKEYDAENNIIHGISYKGKGWDEPLKFKTYYDYSNHSEWWASFQQKYPNPRNGLPIDWDPLYSLIKFVVDSDDETFKKEIGKMIDIDNFVDYTIFLCFTYAHDNTGKNAYWSIYDMQDPEMSKFFITVWDLKSTWGRSWHPGPTSPSREWMDSDPEHDSALFRRLVLTNAYGFADKVRERWEEVKVGNFSPDAVKALFIKYFDLFEASGAFEREAEKWEMVLNGHKNGKLALAAEREYILKWIDLRYEYIDDFIMNKLDTVGDFAPAPARSRRR